MKEVAAFLKLSAANFVTFNALGGARKKLAVTRSDREELVNERWATIVENLLDKNQTSVKELLQGALAQTMTKKGDNRGAIGDLIHKLMNNEWLQKYLKKCTGANSKVPPRADWTATAWTFFGVLITLLLMSSLNKFAVTKIGAEGEKPGEYFIMLGSFGALLTLLFGAPASPLCQPRNVIFGTTYSAFVAVCVRYLSAEEHLDVLPPWLAAALVPAIAIAGMAKLGVLHPPAGAASLIFIAGGKKVTELGFMYLVMPLLVGNIICTCMAILFNNLNSKRQYPLFW
jgi:CBS-domain-containing membrane protein